jgi:hypothetical protein
MKLYKKIYQEDLFKEFSKLEEQEYWQFCEYVISSNYGELLIEWSLPKFLQDKIHFVKELAIETGIHIKDLFTLFMNKWVFKLFSILKWSFVNLVDYIKKGYKVYSSIHEIIHEWLQKNKVVKWTSDKAKELGDFLEKHPMIKKIGGVVLAGLLMYLFFFGSNLGHLGIDFDLSSVIDALTGHLNIGHFLAGPDGIALIIAIASSAIGFSIGYGGISNTAKFILGLVYTLGIKLKVHLQKAHEDEKEVDKELKDLHLATESKKYKKIYVS